MKRNLKSGNVLFVLLGLSALVLSAGVFTQLPAQSALNSEMRLTSGDGQESNGKGKKLAGGDGQESNGKGKKLAGGDGQESNGKGKKLV